MVIGVLINTLINGVFNVFNATLVGLMFVNSVVSIDRHTDLYAEQCD